MIDPHFQLGNRPHQINRHIWSWAINPRGLLGQCMCPASGAGSILAAALVLPRWRQAQGVLDLGVQVWPARGLFWARERQSEGGPIGGVAWGGGTSPSYAGYKPPSPGWVTWATAASLDLPLQISLNSNMFFVWGWLEIQNFPINSINTPEW